MEQSFVDLLSGAFSETSVPSFPDGDLDFENLNFDHEFEDEKTDISQENLPTKEDAALHQEATGQTAVLSSMETKDVYMSDEERSDDKNNEENFQSVGVVSMDETPEEDYTSSDGESDQEGSVSGEDEEEEEEDTGTGEKPGDLLMSVCCGDEFCDGNKEDRIFAEGQPLAPENPQVRNEEQGESESDEEVRYFERVPERGSEMIIKGDGIEEDEQERGEEKQENLSDSECEGMKIEQEESVLARQFEQEVENLCRDGPARATLEFPVFTEVDSEECEEKMKEFSGEEHQEAGESFADYPSDFSSCDYVEDRGQNQESKHQPNALACSSDSGSVAKQNTCLEGAVTDITWTGRAEVTDEEEGDEYLYSRDLEADVDKFRSLNVATGEKDRGEIETVEHVLGDAAVAGSDDGGETCESDSYSSSDDEVQGKRSDEELVDHTCLQDLENHKQLLHGGSSAAFARWSTSDDYSGADPADFNINWNLDVLTTDTLLSEDLLTTEDADKAETLLSDVTQRPAGGVSSYSVVQRWDDKATSPSNRGSLDDSFFFDTKLEASGTTELGQLGDDEYEEERNWEQEEERIKAFYEFYDDGDGKDGREGRQIKVQFRADPLSQVIRYETDSSDRDSLSSSTDGEEDLSSAETSEELKEPDHTTPETPACDPPNPQLPENRPDVSNTHICTRKHKCLNMLKLMLTMGVVIVMGLLMFWLATEQGGWFGQASFF